MAVARADALIAVFDAKYHYEFWRPVTAIRNGDIDDNPATERDATWTPTAETPMHPGIPMRALHSGREHDRRRRGAVRHCRGAGSLDNDPTLPDVTHRWTNVRALDTEVSEARIWAGLHYRFSVNIGQDMGRKIGGYVVKNFMQPVAVARAERCAAGLAPPRRLSHHSNEHRHHHSHNPDKETPS